MLKTIILYTLGIIAILLSLLMTVILVQLIQTHTKTSQILLGTLSVVLFLYYLYRVFKALKEDLKSKSNTHLAYTIALNGLFLLVFINIFS